MNIPSEPNHTATTAPSVGSVTTLLVSWSNGDRAALDALMPLVHDELKRVARRHLWRERPNHTIQATALVNEAFMRLVDERAMHWHDRGHFFAVVARMMRCILVDYARRRHTDRRGGGRQVALDAAGELADGRSADVLAIDAALADLARLDERKARVAEMRLFAGLTADQAAQALGVSPVTIARDWRFARAWLQRELVR